MTRELAWKPRCAVIMFVNSWARSTFDISTVPAVVKPSRRAGVPTVAVPEFGDCSQRLRAGALEARLVRERRERQEAGGDAGAAAGRRCR